MYLIKDSPCSLRASFHFSVSFPAPTSPWPQPGPQKHGHRDPETRARQRVGAAPLWPSGMAGCAPPDMGSSGFVDQLCFRPHPAETFPKSLSSHPCACTHACSKPLTCTHMPPKHRSTRCHSENGTEDRFQCLKINVIHVCVQFSTVILLLHP